MKKRALSLFLALTMVLGMVPSSAYAAEIDSTAAYAESAEAAVSAEEESPVADETSEAEEIALPEEAETKETTEEITAAAEETAAPAEETTAAAEETTAAPEETTAAETVPAETTAAAEEASMPEGILAAGTLDFSKNLKSEPLIFAAKPWTSTKLTVAVSTYTPAGGEATAIPEGTSITYTWYQSTDGQISDSDPEVSYWSSADYSVSLTNKGIYYYYAVATATIGDAEYKGVSVVQCVKIGAADIKVKFSVNNKGILAADKNGNVVGGNTVTVQDLNADGVHSYDEALMAAHKALLAEDGYAKNETETGTYVTKLWGVETSNILFYQNGKAIETTVDQDTVAANDTLYASINQDDKYYSDKFTTFDLTSKSITAGLDVELTLTDSEGNAVPNMQIGTWKESQFVPMEGVTTDENGKITLNFDETGSYVITATGTIKDMVTDYSKYPETSEVEFDCPIMPPVCTVNVKGQGELVISGNLPTTTLNFKVGESAYVLKNKLTPEFYVDGKKDYSANISSSWYRIGARSSGQAQKVDSLYSAITSSEVGKWKYYMYAECEIYGIKYTAMSNFVNVEIREAAPIPGDSSHGFVKSMNYGSNEIEFSPDVTEYDVIGYSNSGGYKDLSTDALKGSGLWVGIRVNGIRQNATSYYVGDTEVKVTYPKVSEEFPRWTTPGKDYVVTILVGTKYDSDGNGTINGLDDFDEYDAYNFNVSVLPCFTKIGVAGADGNSILSDTKVTSSELNGATNSDTVKLTVNAEFDKGVKLYIGNDETPYTSMASNVEVSLADYKDADGVAHIPLVLAVDKEDGTTAEKKLMLNLSPAEEPEPEPDFDAPEIISQPEDAVYVDKNGTVALTVEAKQPEKGTLSYQWTNGYYADGAKVIEGATSATYLAPGGTEAGDSKYYYCKVTLTIDGKSRTTISNRIKVVTNLTYVNDPVITIQPGIAADKNGGGVYNKEYVAGGKFDTMYFAIQASSFRVDGKWIEATEDGCGPIQVQCYYNTEPSTEGAIPLDGEYQTPSTGTLYGVYYAFLPAAGLPEGDNYVYFVVTSSAADDPTKTASTRTDFVKLTYSAATYDFEGKGTEEEPFLLKSGDDFVTLQKYVNEDKIHFSGLHFQLANDVYLPEDWESIGNDETSTTMNVTAYFSGVLDGGGYQLNYAKGSQPLFKYTSQATIRNMKIYGEEIQGCGLINDLWLDYNNVGAWLENITLVSGTSTLRAGLMQGNFSSTNPSYINNCHAEEGVIIGYTKEGGSFGTFAGSMVGEISNCTSAATIYGGSNIGGMVGTKSNSMGRLNVTNCSFTGKIEATGNYIGGMVGRGYSAASAPNATCVRIQNCYVNADITGGNWVGGLFGGEYWIEQCWENGIGMIKNNVFYGSLTATDGKTGGIIGWMSSLNRYNEIENNYYYDANGCTTPIGGVEHIDTSTHKLGMGDDGIFYYDTSRDSLDDIKDFVDAEDKGTSDWNYTSVSKTNCNRNDDPMGADKDKLGMAVTTEQMTDGTVLKWLNDYESGLKNWVQGDKYPEHSKEKSVVSLTVSGDYKTEFTVGDELDLTGIVLTAAWTDGTKTNPALSEVEIKGYDKDKVGKQTVTLTYGTASVEISVTVLPEEAQIEVVFSILGDEQHDSDTDGKVHTLTSDNLITWVEAKEYTISNTITVADLLDQVLDENGMSCTYLSSNYVDSITSKDGVTLAGQTNGVNSGWMFTVNGVHGLLGVSEQYMEDGDVIVFHYTDNYTLEQDKTPDQPGKPEEPTEPAGVEGFVTRLYKNVLGRTPDKNGFNAWVNVLTKGTNGGEEVAKGFIFSDEYMKQNTGSDVFVEMLYNTLLGRKSDAAGKKAWVAQVNAGVSREEIVEGFIHSNEFTGLCKKDGIYATAAEAFAARLYTKCLERNYDADGLKAWADLLHTRKIGGGEAAKGFFLSSEFLGKKLSDQEFVTRCYRTFLNREPDAQGLKDWNALLAKGDSRESILDGFIGSGEYAKLCVSYGIDR